MSEWACRKHLQQNRRPIVSATKKTTTDVALRKRFGSVRVRKNFAETANLSLAYFIIGGCP